MIAVGPHPEERPSAPRIAGLVLAAGQSRRMGGSNKLLALIDGKPMICHVAETVLQSQLHPVIVVLGHEAQRMREALAGIAVILAENKEFSAGLSTSLRCGLACLPGDIDGVLVLLGDMPGITRTEIDRLVSAYCPAEGRMICVPSWKGRRGNPVLWDRRFFSEMSGISGDVGARHLLQHYPDCVHEVAMPGKSILTDIDTPRALWEFLATRAKAPIG
jgi:molybdenum cofactor cytidylyltransferase